MRRRIAEIGLPTGTQTAWNPDASSTVRALAVKGGKVYAGGSFNNIGGSARSRVAALDQVTGLATQWDPGNGGPNGGEVDAIAVASDGTVYLGGAFTSTGGQTRNRIAAIDSSGVATSWNPNANGQVFALKIGGNRIYAGGSFTSIGGVGDQVAALDPATGLADPLWRLPVNSTVQALALSGSSEVILGGAFGTVANMTQACIARVRQSIVVGVGDPLPGALTLWARVSPNPTAGPTRLEYAMPRAGHVRISVYDVQGRLLARPIDAMRPAGLNSLEWNARASGIRAGVYFLGFELGGNKLTRRLIVVR